MGAPVGLYTSVNRRQIKSLKQHRYRRCGWALILFPAATGVILSVSDIYSASGKKLGFIRTQLIFSFYSGRKTDSVLVIVTHLHDERVLVPGDGLPQPLSCHG